MTPYRFQPGELESTIVGIVVEEASEKVRLFDLLDSDGRPYEGLVIGSDEIPINSLDLLRMVDRVATLFHLDRWGNEDNLLRWRSLGRWCEQVAITWGQDPAEVTFFSSGTTGEKKACTHSLAHLIRECQFWQDMFSDAQRIVSVVPPHHIYGFIFSVLLPKLLGIPVTNLRHLPPTSAIGRLRSGDLIVSHPFWWQQVQHKIAKIPEAVTSVVSTAPMPDPLYQQILTSKLTRLVQIYGSSETAGVGFRESPNEPYKLLPYWNRSEDPRHLRCQEATAVEVQDHLEWQGEHHFKVTGRRDDVVQIAGTNVSPAIVAEKLKNSPLVKEVAIRVVTTDDSTKLLKAFIVLKADRPDENTKHTIFKWAREYLRPPEQPSFLTFGVAIPRDQLGKLKDWSV
jgi:4-coumarate--CoA ligase (photoactive yellow protein activation family)